MKTSGAQFLIDYLIEEKIPYFAGIPGHSLYTLMDAMYNRQDKIKNILVRHEHVAVCLADGYFRATGKPLAIYAHMGPGAANMLNGLAAAYLDSVGMVLITGNTWQTHFGRNASQDMLKHYDGDQPGFIRPLVKRSFQVQRVEQLPEILHRAFAIAVSGRPGPVHIDMPLSVQAEVADLQMPNPTKHKPLCKIRGDKKAIEKAVDLLMTAEKPVIIAGSGARFSGASNDIVELAEYLGCPVSAAHRGLGVIPDDHPLFIGMCGSEARGYTNPIIAEADVILAVGMRFTEPDTSSWQPGAPFNIPPSKLIHIDIDTEELGRHYPTELGIWGDAACVIEEMLAAVKALKGNKKPAFLESERIKAIAAAKEEWWKKLEPYATSNATPIRPERLVYEVRKALPRDGIAFIETGKVKNWCFQQLPIYTPDSFYVGIGWTTLGHAPAAALGVKLAKPDRKVVVMVGDGSFQQVPWSLSTAVDYDLPVVFVVFDDYGFGSTRQTLAQDFDGHYIACDFKNDKTGELSNPDFAALAKAYGANGEKVTDPSQISAALERAFASNQPYVLDVVVDRDAHFWKAKPRVFKTPPQY